MTTRCRDINADLWAMIGVRVPLLRPKWQTACASLFGNARRANLRRLVADYGLHVFGLVRVAPGDPHGLDRDGDGIGCEYGGGHPLLPRPDKKGIPKEPPPVFHVGGNGLTNLCSFDIFGLLA
jgi:hypothetical protein